MAPQFGAYVLTFIFIATMWVNHHYMFSEVKVINTQTIWLNILLLFFASLLPATTAWFGTDVFSRVAGVLYVLNMMFYNIVTALLRRQIVQLNHITTMGNLLRSEVGSFIVNTMTLVVTFFYPPFLFLGLLINVSIWFAPRPSKPNNR
ncbi:membrane protein [Lactiplantibacillus brownii]